MDQPKEARLPENVPEETKSEYNLAQVLVLLLAVIAIFRLLFQNDSGKIVSNQGAKVLENEGMMKDVRKQIESVKDLQNQETTPHEVLIDLD